MKLYWKLARPDGFDFYTGHTINYRDALASGQPVRPPKANRALGLCSPGVLHAAETPEQCFVGARIPCAVFRVTGRPVARDDTKHGFLSLRVVEECDPTQVFAWRYAEAVRPLNPLALPPALDDAALALLRDWASVWDSVGASVWDSVGAPVWASAGASVGASVWDSVGAPVWASAGASVWASVRDSGWASVEDSVWASVRDSVEASVEAYVGWLFVPVVPAWHIYPYQASVDLWRRGLVPSYDGRIWRLHGHADGRVLWQGTVQGA